MKGKIKIGATISPMAYNHLEMMEANEPFSSRSDIVEKTPGGMFSVLNSGHLRDCETEYSFSLCMNTAGHTASVMGVT
jgi:hypothetical protein